MEREKSKAPEFYGPMAGALGGELKKHSYERCRIFFFYLFYAKALVDYLNRAHGQSIGYEDLVLGKASHQIDEGFRSKHADYHDFDSTDPGVLNISCTAFRNTDAAHSCNLGVKEDFVTLIAGFFSDVKTLDLYERLKSMMGTTRRFPKRVNLGPDRVIDNLHGKLAVPMLTNTGQKLIGTSNIGAYLQRAADEMGGYKARQLKAKNDGVAACAQCYLDTYLDAEVLQRLYGDVHRAVAGDCWGLGFRPDDYLD
jgi:hypothetical protein